MATGKQTNSLKSTPVCLFQIWVQKESHHTKGLKEAGMIISRTYLKKKISHLGPGVA
jgi:hypothetical protein